ncbi:olfactory receptor-like protein OLF1 [Microcaecilia unicolor]|uniref:Olfactory receptor n=1 Tax=Microcaecilia unicolor TaxID=1415580 RepID=A0A6P7WQM0_9AMPH|nr:olfactory receptor-like protein OLF1 [Microcaecilia unicolor]
MSDMEMDNKTLDTEFLVLGFSNQPILQGLFFAVFLSIYLVNLIGNVAILTLVFVNLGLHKPMYFFLSNLAILDICLSSCTLPKMLVLSLRKSKSVPFSECMTQLYLIMAFTSTEFFLLAAMAYDRYAAICSPLHYSMIMNKRVCGVLVASSWMSGFLCVLPHSIWMCLSSFCGHNTIDHFFCDLQTLLKLSCSDTSVIEMLLVTLNMGLATGCFLLILVSYFYIISSILKIRSAEGRRKAFSTCSSHLTVVIIYSITVLLVYVRSRSMNTLPGDKLFGVLYNAVIPMLNPIIYTLRNKEVKSALMKGARRKTVG